MVSFVIKPLVYLWDAMSQVINFMQQIWQENEFIIVINIGTAWDTVISNHKIINHSYKNMVYMLSGIEKINS